MNTLSKAESKEILEYDTVDLLKLLEKINNERESHNITYSRNVFLPLTHICQNNCGYCTFKEKPEDTENLLMTETEVTKLIRKSTDYNCTEALFTFGESADKTEVIQDKLTEYGYESMIDYVYNLSNDILLNYDILPHTNMGIISKEELYKLKSVNASMGLMLETTNKQLLKTIVHKDSPGKNPKKRIQLIKNAGIEKIPFTTGLLIGIGESVDDHINSLYKIRELQDKYGHIQEIILQNFVPKPGIPMENYPESPVIDLIKIVLLAHILFPDVSIQIPPNLNQKMVSIFSIAGADDLGGISPITKDYVNPDQPWPQVTEIEKELSSINFNLTERLPVYPKYINKNFLEKEIYEKTVMLQKRIKEKR